MDPKIWQKIILDTVKEIADKNVQSTLWLGKNTADSSSPEEAYDTLFEEFSFDEFLESESSGLTNEQRTLGTQLVQALDEYSLDGSIFPDVEEMLEDPDWDVVRGIASKFLATFQ